MTQTRPLYYITIMSGYDGQAGHEYSSATVIRLSTGERVITVPCRHGDSETMVNEIMGHLKGKYALSRVQKATKLADVAVIDFYKDCTSQMVIHYGKSTF